MIKSTVRAPDMILTYGNEIDRRREHTVPLGIIRLYYDKSRELTKKTKARDFPKRFTITDVITVHTPHNSECQLVGYRWVRFEFIINWQRQD